MADEDDDGKFDYTDPRTGKTSKRSLDPSNWETMKERMMDSAEIDKAREAAKNYRAMKNYNPKK